MRSDSPGKTDREWILWQRGGGTLVLLVVLALAVVLGLTVWFLPVSVRAHVRQERWLVRLEVQVAAPLIKWKGNVNISDRVRMAIEHMWKRWRATGEPVKIPLQKTIRRVPTRKIRRALRRPLRYAQPRVHCEHLEIRAEVGTGDAMESALLTGFTWALVGTGIGQFSRFVHVDPKVPRVVITPIFSGTQFRLQADCILKVRLGHAIVTGVWLLRRMLKEREIVAWARDSWRRKGEEGNEQRSPDSGSDEDRHGVD